MSKKSNPEKGKEGRNGLQIGGDMSGRSLVTSPRPEQSVLFLFHVLSCSFLFFSFLKLCSLVQSFPRTSRNHGVDGVVVMSKACTVKGGGCKFSREGLRRAHLEEETFAS